MNKRAKYYLITFVIHASYLGLLYRFVRMSDVAISYKDSVPMYLLLAAGFFYTGYVMEKDPKIPIFPYLIFHLVIGFMCYRFYFASRNDLLLQNQVWLNVIRSVAGAHNFAFVFVLFRHLQYHFFGHRGQDASRTDSEKGKKKRK